MNIEINEAIELSVLRESLATIRGQTMYAISEIKAQYADISIPDVRAQTVLQGLQRKVDTIDKLY